MGIGCRRWWCSPLKNVKLQNFSVWHCWASAHINSTFVSQQKSWWKTMLPMIVQRNLYHSENHNKQIPSTPMKHCEWCFQITYILCIGYYAYFAINIKKSIHSTFLNQQFYIICHIYFAYVVRNTLFYHIKAVKPFLSYFQMLFCIKSKLVMLWFTS